MKEARKMRINASNYTMYGSRLYRKGYSTPWLKCITSREVEVVMQEVYSGICGAHEGSRATT